MYQAYYARYMPGMIRVHKIRDRYWTNTTQYVWYINHIAIRHVDTTNTLIFPGVYHTYSWYQSIHHQYGWTRFIYRVASDHPCMSWYKVYSRHIQGTLVYIYTWYIPGIYLENTMYIGIYNIPCIYKVYIRFCLTDGIGNLTLIALAQLLMVAIIIHVLGCCEIRSPFEQK